MPVHSVLQVVIDEAIDLLDELANWSREAPRCPRCLSLPGCSHEAGCPLGRVARLRCLLDPGDERHRHDALVELRRERGIPIKANASHESALPLVLSDVTRGAHPANDTPTHAEALHLVTDAGPRVEAEDDARARAFVIETLQVAATRCFAEASATRGASEETSSLRATAAALASRAGRYAEAAAEWLIRNGADALLGQRALLHARDRQADPGQPEGAPR